MNKRPQANVKNYNSIAFVRVPVSTITYYCKKCVNIRCFTCNSFAETSHFCSTMSNTTFPLLSAMNCNVSNVVYLITCNICSIQYVGETGMRLRDRLNVHRSCVTTSKLTPIGIHFNANNHSFKNLRIIPIEQLTIKNNNFRKSRELYWQLKLNTVFPNGLNGYPIDNPHFKNVNINAATDLQILWSLYQEDSD